VGGSRWCHLASRRHGAASTRRRGRLG
jgi:hypothetical protein